MSPHDVALYGGVPFGVIVALVVSGCVYGSIVTQRRSLREYRGTAVAEIEVSDRADAPAPVELTPVTHNGRQVWQRSESGFLRLSMSVSMIAILAAFASVAGGTLYVADRLPSLPDVPFIGGDGGTADRHNGRPHHHRDGKAAHHHNGKAAGRGGGHTAHRRDGATARRQAVTAAQLHADLADVQVVDTLPYVPGYDREARFGDWIGTPDGCDMRQQILRRDMTGEVLDGDGCTVLTGTLRDPYTGATIHFTHDDYFAVQIDHVVPLAFAWQAGAARWSDGQREAFANDPQNLVAAGGPANMSKGDSSPAEWMPPNEAYACAYADRFVNVVTDYGLRITDEDLRRIQETERTECPR